MRTLILIMILLFSSCQWLEDAAESVTEEVTDPINDTVDNAVDDLEGSPPKTVCPNPIVEAQTFGKGGNLYKPVADSGGNLVVLFDSQFKGQFDSCTIEVNGEPRDLNCIDNAPWTQIPFSCFSNPLGDGIPRQTWRADFKCKKADKVVVKCKDSCQEVTFSAPSGSRNKVCQRFG